MKLNSSRVLLTGAAGGIGSAVASELVRRGARVLMVDRNREALASAARAAAFPSAVVDQHVCDLTSSSERAELCKRAAEWNGGVNILINNAGLNPFGLFESLSSAQIDAALAVNLHAPMFLCQQMLPQLRRQAPSVILNTGSVFGAIGFPGYVAYSTTKFAMRGFSEALRRELAGSGVEVKYLAPRATQTPINSMAVESMNRELGVAMDPPERVARELVALLQSGEYSATVGWPEKLFVRINALWPKLVDGAARKQLPIIERYARGSAPQAAVTSPPKLRGSTP
jgi:short-subunit dehydrogenase